MADDSSSNPTEITNATVGVNLDNDDPNFGAGTGTTTLNVSGVSISGVPTGIRVGDVPLSGYYYGPTVAGNVVLNLSGGSITGAATGIDVEAQSTGSYTATVNVSSGASDFRSQHGHFG